jgi:hypothetical protein
VKHTVIAVFDKAEEAQKAAQALRTRGFEAPSVHVTQGEQLEVIPPAAEIEGGNVKGLLHRLSLLFGVEEPHFAEYEEAVRRGGHVVQVDAEDEDQAAASRDTLLAMGAVDIEDRVAEWQAEGWRGATAGGPAGGKGIVVQRTEVSGGGVRVYRHRAWIAFEQFADEFRADYEARYAAPGGTYEDFDPAYRYGHALASDSRYVGRGWDAVEPEARAEWERRHPQSAWERFKGAVRHAWERAARG